MATSYEDPRPGSSWRLAAVFGAMAFLQGVIDPTEGLLAHPVRALLRIHGRSPAEITAFSALLAVPWLLKPLFGLLCDAVPLAGMRRKSYLVATSGLAALGFLGAFAFPAPEGSAWGWLAWLLVPTAAVAFADVAADALMVEEGQPRGLTGRIQAVQWASLCGSGIVVGLAGGALSGRLHAERRALLICAAGAVLSLVVIGAWVREPAQITAGVGGRETLRILRRAARSPTILGVGGFLFLWNFNPFSNAVLHIHMVRGMGFSEGFYGRTLSLWAVASIAASLAYGMYCRRFATRRLAEASIVLGVISTLGYALMVGERSAVAVTLAFGFTYMTATLIQLDLAARACPPAAAGTVFALLMALENLAASLSTWLGGALYERGGTLWGDRGAFRVLVAVGAALTASCWLLLPYIPREKVDARGAADL